MRGSSPVPKSPDASSHRFSIAARLRWSYLISSTLPLLIVGLALLAISAAAQQASVYAEQRTLAARISRGISVYVDKLSQQIDSFSAIVRPGTTDPDTWRNAAVDMVNRNYPDLISLTVVGADGKELMRVSRLQPVPASELRDLSEDDSIQRALRNGERVFSPIILDEDGTKGFMLTVPLPNDAGATIGALQVEMNAEPVMQELRETTAGSQSIAYIVRSDDGAIIIDDGAAHFVPPTGLVELLDSATGAAQYDGARNRIVIGALEPVKLSQSQRSIGWLVVVEQAAGIAFASLYRQVLVLAGLVALVGALALLWAFRFARGFLKPLDGLRAGALALGDGHLDYRIAAPSDDELGDVASSFNQMASRLQESQAEIERQNEHLRHGLALARDIQVGLLPDRAPWTGDAFDVYARSIPAYEVGGDFYSYLALPEGRAAIAIGDISGKGVGAALIMALTSSAVESQARQIESPAEVLTALNQLLAPRLKANHMNAALLFMVFDPHERTVTVANGGMIAPVLISASGNRFIDVSGLPVGAFAGAVYREQVVHLAPDDVLLLVSDGVVEAHDQQGSLFGFERLERTIALADTTRSVRSLVEMVLDEVHGFMGDAEQHDDITMVAIRMAVSVQTPQRDEEQSVTYASV